MKNYNHLAMFWTQIARLEYRQIDALCRLILWVCVQH